MHAIHVKSIFLSVTVQAKGKEREWLKHQTYGDLDEAKLIEGLTGEKAIYRRRGEKEPEVIDKGNVTTFLKSSTNSLKFKMQKKVMSPGSPQNPP